MDIRDHGGVFGGGMYGVRSYQHGTAVVSSTATTVNIGKVNPNKAIVLILGVHIDSVITSDSSRAARLVAPGTVSETSFVLHKGNANPVKVRWAVIELANAKSVQRGNNTLTSDLSYPFDHATIASGKKQIIVYATSNHTESTTPTSDFHDIEVVSSTRFRVLQQYAVPKTYYYQVVELS